MKFNTIKYKKKSNSSQKQWRIQRIISLMTSTMHTSRTKYYNVSWYQHWVTVMPSATMKTSEKIANISLSSNADQGSMCVPRELLKCNCHRQLYPPYGTGYDANNRGTFRWSWQRCCENSGNNMNYFIEHHRNFNRSNGVKRLYSWMKRDSFSLGIFTCKLLRCFQC